MITPYYYSGNDGVRLAFREIGRGRPLLLFHGYMGSARLWIDPGYAGKFAALGHRVILPDLRGHGDSDKPHQATAYPPDVLSDDALALVAQLGLVEYDVGGYSLGARVVLRMLARGARPGCAVLGGQGLDILDRATERTIRNRNILSKFGTFENGTREKETENWIQKTGGDPVALLHVLYAFVDTPREALAQIQVPTLVIAGTEDRERASADQLAALLPNGRYKAIPGDHLSAFTNPEFIAAIIDFLEPTP